MIKPFTKEINSFIETFVNKISDQMLTFTCYYSTNSIECETKY
jgi:hypothetical protein